MTLFLFLALFTPQKARAGAGQLNFMVFGNYNLMISDVSSNPANVPGNNGPYPGTFGNGYGLGVGFGYWLTDNLVFRMMVQGNTFPGNPDAASLGDSVQSVPITAGFKVRLIGDPTLFLFAVADGGGSYQELLSGNGFFGGKELSNGWSAYGDTGIGVQDGHFFVEVKVAWLPRFDPGVSGRNNSVVTVPVTAGIAF